MKYRLLYFTLSLLSLYVPLFASVTFLEPGKTWWYESGVASEGSGFMHTKVTVGLTLEEPESIGSDLFPCYAIDSLNQNIIDIPIGYLRENENKVWVTPNSDLLSIDRTNCSNELKVLSTFLGYWNITNIIANLETNIYGPSTEGMWKMESIATEYLLYDFNYIIGDAYKWPWSQIDYLDLEISKDDYNYSDIENRGFFITDIKTTEFDSFQDKPEGFNVFYVRQSELDYVKYSYKPCIIIEGVGITNGSIFSYFPEYKSWYGFFLSPASICLLNLSGYYEQPYIPKLMAVIKSDGTHLYGDSSYQPSANIKNLNIDNDISGHIVFDFLGRPVSTPLPGSVYIRNGKKFVGK